MNMATAYQPFAHAAPVYLPGDEPFAQAAREGRLLIKRCKACGQPHYYPRALCPHCMSDDVQWEQAKGTGTVYTFSITRRNGPVPYAIAYVTLDEGVSLMTHIVDCDLDSIRIGQAVRLVHKPTDGDVPVACFTPV